MTPRILTSPPLQRGRLDTRARLRACAFGRPRLINQQFEAEARALKAKGLVKPEIARRVNFGGSTT